jgi:type IV secretory pathway VirB9-like protein
MRRLIAVCGVLLAGGSVVSAQGIAKKGADVKEPSQVISWAPKEAHKGWREIQMTRDVEAIDTELGYTTSIVLPAKEEVMDVAYGAVGLWVVDSHRNKESGLSATNIVHVKPAKAGAKTDLQIINNAGRIYSFRLREGAKPAGQADVTVYLAADPTTVAPSSPGVSRKYVDAERLDALETELANAKAAIEVERAKAAEQVSQAKVEAVANQSCDYVAALHKKPFDVESICHDGTFTYIKLSGKARPVLFQRVDGRPTVPEYTIKDRTYIVSSVVEDGYLAQGKEEFKFKLRAGN